MNQSNRKSKMSRYKVRVTRCFEQVFDVTCEARNAEEAEDVAMAQLEAETLGSVTDHSTTVTAVTAKAKIIRDA